jgi:magnesium transporter
MLTTYASADGRLTPRYADDPNATAEAVWIDLVSPLEDESKRVGNALGMEIPSRAEMEEIELSSRLYQEDGAEFMTMIALANLDSDEVRKTPVTFILKGRTLVTVRYAEPRPFAAFAARAQRPNALPIQDGEMVMLGLLEAMIDRIADALERTGNDIDAISTDVFHAKGNAQRRTRNLRSLIERIGQQGDLLTKFRESLVSMTRLTGYHTTLQDAGRGGGKETRSRIKVVQRDAASLSEHANFLSNKVNFLLDATLGLINLEQNQIIKIFSVAAVVLLPPTLVASNYGMNFDFMPELHWLFGYPFAVFLMFLSSLLPYLYFKRKGWL